MNKNDVPLRDYVKLYELALYYEGKTPATLRIYLSNLGRFCRYLDEHLKRPPMLSDLTDDNVVAFIMDLKRSPSYANHPYKTECPKPVSAATIDQHVRTLKGFATWLYEKRYTRTNVLKLLPRPKRPQLTVEPLTDDEVKRLLASIDTRSPLGTRNYTIIVTLLDTGLRLGELCSLEMKNVHMDSRQCYVKVFGKGQKERIVYLGRRAHEALLTLRHLRAASSCQGSCRHALLRDQGRTPDQPGPG